MSTDLAQKFERILAALSGLEGHINDIKGQMNAGALGFMEQKPGRRVVYAHEKNGSLWHFYNTEKGEVIPIQKRFLRGWLRDIYMYTKEHPDYGESEKLCVVLDTGGQEYIVETGAVSTTGRSLDASLRAVNPSLLINPVTLYVSEGGEKENVVFMDMIAGDDLVLTEKEHYPPKESPEATRSAMAKLRKKLGWSPADPYEASPFDGTVGRDNAGRKQEGKPAKNGSSSGRMKFDPQNPPSVHGSSNGTLSKKDATLLWNAASKKGGHTEDTFEEMLMLEFGVEHPMQLSSDDWEDAWRKADREIYEEEQKEEEEETFEPDDALPF